MKKLLFAIFAHPDDEAFGPCGTLIKEVAAGTEVHLLCLTRGEAGANPDAASDLGAVRLEEWQAAAKLIGVATTKNFELPDGQLNNQMMISSADSIEAYVNDILAAQQAREVEFLTLDLNGLTGHIDHIVAARAASLVFFRLKNNDPRLTNIRYYCLPKATVPDINTRWVFQEAGHAPEVITQTVDARKYLDTITAAMDCHQSQRVDARSTREQHGDSLGIDSFIVAS